MAHWNGSAWEALGQGLSVSDAFNPPMGKAAACLGEDLFVAGFFDFAGGKPSVGLARWTQQTESIGIRAAAGRAQSQSSGWRLFTEGRLSFSDSAFTGGGFDARDACFEQN